MQSDIQEPFNDVNNLTKGQLYRPIFDYAASPPVKSSMKRMVCTFCRVVGRDFRTCQRCKGPRYCSKECQRNDWPEHKAFCVSYERSNPLKLLHLLSRNPTIMWYLVLAIVLDLDLTNDTKRDIGFKFPFVAKVDVGIEPCDCDTFMTLLETDDPVPDNVEGMPQIHRLRYAKGIGPRVDRDLLIAARAKADSTGRRDMPVGTIEFFLNGQGTYMCSALIMDSDTLDYARERHPMKWPSSEEGKVNEEKLTVAFCLNFINYYVAADNENQMKLRTTMTDSDKATIRKARDESVNTPQ